VLTVSIPYSPFPTSYLLLTHSLFTIDHYQMNFRITHITEYIYNETVGICHNIARLIPRDTEKQVCKNINIHISPLPDVQNEYDDFFGNHVCYFVIQHEHKKMRVSVTSEITKAKSFNYQIDLYQKNSWEEVIELLSESQPEFLDAKQYIAETKMTESTPEIKTYALQSFTPGRPLFEATQDLMHRIYHNFEFEPGITMVATPLSEVMAQRKGVCQDFAHLAISCLRSIGLPARYVSGYIETIPPEGQEKLVGVDASHAWFAVFIPGMGWMEFDPTNNQIPGDQHITIGWGRDYADIAPLKGVLFSSSTQQLKVSVDMRRI